MYTHCDSSAGTDRYYIEVNPGRCAREPPLSILEPLVTIVSSESIQERPVLEVLLISSYEERVPNSIGFCSTAQSCMVCVLCRSYNYNVLRVFGYIHVHVYQILMMSRYTHLRF